jgi:hypothetical protein
MGVRWMVELDVYTSKYIQETQPLAIAEKWGILVTLTGEHS